MDSMDNFRERFEALEQQTEQLQQHTRMVERRLRWWCGIACGVIVLALLGIPLQSGKAQYEDKDLAQRVKDLEYKLQYVTGGPNEVVITGANLRIVNGLGTTETTNELGNLIVGYNEERGFGLDTRTGSHNIVVGRAHNFSSFGGLVGGFQNEISGRFSSVCGGNVNIVTGDFSSVSGGDANTASGLFSSVSGGSRNIASGFGSSVSGGFRNIASGLFSSVSGGDGNIASSFGSSVSGGNGNIASGNFSSVSGGANRSAPGTDDWAAGPLFADN
jgi:hypothetical protein